MYSPYAIINRKGQAYHRFCYDRFFTLEEALRVIETWKQYDDVSFAYVTEDTTQDIVHYEVLINTVGLKDTPYIHTNKGEK